MPAVAYCANCGAPLTAGHAGRMCDTCISGGEQANCAEHSSQDAASGRSPRRLRAALRQRYANSSIPRVLSDRGIRWGVLLFLAGLVIGSVLQHSILAALALLGFGAAGCAWFYRVQGKLDPAEVRLDEQPAGTRRDLRR